MKKGSKLGGLINHWVNWVNKKGFMENIKELLSNLAVHQTQQNILFKMQISGPFPQLI